MKPGTPAARPWTAEEMPNGTGHWQVVASSAVGDGSRGQIVALYLHERDARDIAAGVNRIEAERRIAAEDPLHS
jgi:hypothetical protein